MNNKREAAFHNPYVKALVIPTAFYANLSPEQDYLDGLETDIALKEAELTRIKPKQVLEAGAYELVLNVVFLSILAGSGAYLNVYINNPDEAATASFRMYSGERRALMHRVFTNVKPKTKFYFRIENNNGTTLQIDDSESFLYIKKV